MATIIERKEKYARLKKGIERAMRYTLKDVEEEGLKVKLIGVLLQAREMLDGEGPSIRG
jgi:hypothetical protein